MFSSYLYSNLQQNIFKKQTNKCTLFLHNACISPAGEVTRTKNTKKTGLLFFGESCGWLEQPHWGSQDNTLTAALNCTCTLKEGPVVGFLSVHYRCLSHAHSSGMFQTGELIWWPQLLKTSKCIWWQLDQNQPGKVRPARTHECCVSSGTLTSICNRTLMCFCLWNLQRIPSLMELWHECLVSYGAQTWIPNV